MKKIAYILILSICFVNCNNYKQNSDSQSSKFCSNELDLLCSFDTIPSIEYSFQSIRDSLSEKLTTVFSDEICCKDLRFNVNHFIDSSESIKLSVNYYYDCINCPEILRETNICLILLNSKGQVAFKGQQINIDSLDNKLYNYYSFVGKADNLPASYDRVKIGLQWDKDVSNEYFTFFINQIINGYIKFVKEYSTNNYEKRFCELNQVELHSISKLIPFGIELPIFEINEIEDGIELQSIIQKTLPN